MGKSRSKVGRSTSSASGSRQDSDDDGGGITCTRVTLVAFNFITLLAGVATLAVGVLLYCASTADPSKMEILQELTTEDTIRPVNKEFGGLGIVLISLGALVTFISFLGCFGACVNGKCLLVLYLICVGVILILQFLVCVFAIIYRHPMSSTLRAELTNHIRHEYRMNSNEEKTWGMVHQTFECCGVEGYSDWFKIDAWPGEQRVPSSCCIDATNITACGESVDPNLWYKQGCLGKFQLTVMEKLHYLASAIITLVFLQLYGIIASTLLLYHVKEPKKPTNYKSYQYEMARR